MVDGCVAYVTDLNGDGVHVPASASTWESCNHYAERYWESNWETNRKDLYKDAARMALVPIPFAWLIMKKLRLLLLMVTPLQLVHSQEVHRAPTVEQCRADQRLWLSKLEGHTYVSASFAELDGWFSEMLDCEKVNAKDKTCSGAT